MKINLSSTQVSTEFQDVSVDLLKFLKLKARKLQKKSLLFPLPHPVTKNLRLSHPKRKEIT